MSFPLRPIAFILAASNHGTMIVNRNDYHMIDSQNVYGVGFEILNNSCFDYDEVQLALKLLSWRLQYFGSGVVAIDGGANIGIHTVEWSRHMYGWGNVIGFEAQEILYYVLAGNVVLNNCLNARVRWAALGEVCGEMTIPQPDYFKSGSFGSLELRQQEYIEFIGQNISYNLHDCTKVRVINLDSLNLDRLDLLKLDVEGMEIDVLRGSRKTISAFHPIMLIEIIKSDPDVIESFLFDLGYKIFFLGINILAIHIDDPTLEEIQKSDDSLIMIN